MKAAKKKKPISDIPAKSHMLTLRVTDEDLERMEMVQRVQQANDIMGAKRHTRSEAIAVLLEWGWKHFSEKNKHVIEDLLKVKKKSA